MTLHISMVTYTVNIHIFFIMEYSCSIKLASYYLITS